MKHFDVKKNAYYVCHKLYYVRHIILRNIENRYG